jgi:hypothetical protein
VLDLFYRVYYYVVMNNASLRSNSRNSETLLDHSIEVAEESVKFIDNYFQSPQLDIIKELAYFDGLMHDAGKALDPYDKLFNGLPPSAGRSANFTVNTIHHHYASWLMIVLFEKHEVVNMSLKNRKYFDSAKSAVLHHHLAVITTSDTKPKKTVKKWESASEAIDNIKADGLWDDFISATEYAFALLLSKAAEMPSITINVDAFDQLISDMKIQNIFVKEACPTIFELISNKSNNDARPNDMPIGIMSEILRSALMNTDRASAKKRRGLI